jgi:GAF domain-containing protein
MVRLKRGNAPKAVRRRRPSAAVLETEVDQLRRELNEALAQQTATADVLKIISRSTIDLQAVLTTLVETASLHCDAYDSLIFLHQSGKLHVKAHYGPLPLDFAEWSIGRGWITGRAFIDRTTIHVHDPAAFAKEFPDGAGMALRLGYRSILAVPLLRENEAIGVITIRRSEAKPFAKTQIELVEAFAHQAVIAIENARLFEAEQRRTAELTEALEQKTATSEVLRVISSSPGDLKPVFDAMLGNAAHLCEAQFGILSLYEGGAIRVAAMHNMPPVFAERFKHEPVVNAGPLAPISRLVATKDVVHVVDLSEDPAYKLRDPPVVSLFELGRVRSILAVPMLKEGELIGALNIYRQEVRPFTEKQIDLIKNFAAQAVIAIENTRLLGELRESLEQQTATADVLRVISSSPTDIQPVLEAIVRTAGQLCASEYAILFRLRDGKYYPTCANNAEVEWVKYFSEHPISVDRGSLVGRTVLDCRSVHIVDCLADPEYRLHEAARLGKQRSMLGVPLLHDGEPIGVLGLLRTSVKPFTEKQIELVTTFADQAVIAIENVRLLNELRESLQQQTATAEVLNVISRSAFDLQPVFETVAESSVRLCGADRAFIFRFDGGLLRMVATYNTPQDFKDWVGRNPIRPGRHSGSARAALERRTIHIPDVLADPEYSYGAKDVEAIRTVLGVPILKGDELLGVMMIYHLEVRPFTDKQIALVETFAGQAAIAIENARLFDDVQKRTQALTESLRQQTATADVLKVISRSAFDLRMVLNTLLQSAAQLCEADQGTVTQRKGDTFYRSVSYGFPAAFAEYVKDRPVELGRDTATGRALLEGKVIHIPDVQADPDYTWKEAQKLGGFRTLLGVPMLREGVPVGVLTLTRSEVRPFTNKQIELVSTFADQAAIAIENVRLFEAEQARTREITESLEQQRATSEVLKVISSSPGELQPVFDAMLENATRLCQGSFGTMWLRQSDGQMRNAALQGSLPGAFREKWGVGTLFRPNPSLPTARVINSLKPVQVVDLREDRSYLERDPLALASVHVAGIRSLVSVPMLKDGAIVGALNIYRQEVRPFTDKQVDLLANFASQAVIAIENARLLSELRQRTADLSRSLDDLRTAQDRLVQTEKLASLGQLTAGIAHEIKNPLNFVNNFSAVSVELIDELREALGSAQLDSKLRAEISEIADMLQGNLDKVVQHGKRADSIVKNMLLHSRQGSGEHRPVDINALVDESLNLAYHGARAEKQGFNITLEKSFDPAAGEVDLFPQEVTRVLLNLISNGFYAATKRKADANGDDYEPTLTAATKNLGDRVEIRIRDNGTGIPSEVKEKLFNPFFTTKPAGEGTGLGLSISHDIIVKQHGGSIEVDTRTGEFTEFRIVLPRRAATVAKSGERW